jgi:murein DD-endopeptidase MepM/ murein hydrolase activator NlpD
LKKIFFIISLFTKFLFADVPLLENLDYQNPALLQLRSEVKENLRISKSMLGHEKLKIRFVKYRVKKEDNFFKIMAKTGMDIDTISSVNYLSSPYDIRVGMILYIPNMRGIYDSEEIPNTEEGKAKIAKKYNVPITLPIYEKEYAGGWFIPGKTLGKLEKSFFYGLAFVPPLLETRISSHYGKRKDPFTKKKTFHGGIDLAAPKGTPVYAAADGEVIFAGEKDGYGQLIIIKHILGFETRYGHLEEILVEEGTKVRKNQQIGLVGNTGRSTGYHLHFEVRRFRKHQKPEFFRHM